MKKIFNIVILLFCVSTVHAATVSMNLATTDFGVDDVFTIDIVATGMTETGGASLGLDFDTTVLSLQGVSMIAGAPFDFVQLSPASSHISGLDVIDMFAPLSANASGDFSMVTLSFLAVGEGASSISIVDNADSVLGWFDAGFNPIADIIYENAAVTVGTITAIPLPAAAWLLISGLGLIGFTARKNK